MSTGDDGRVISMVDLAGYQDLPMLSISSVLLMFTSDAQGRVAVNWLIHQVPESWSS